jgi:hypothetical protein
MPSSYHGAQFRLRGCADIFGKLRDRRGQLDFTSVADKLSSAQIAQVFADSQNGNAGYYVPAAGAAMNNRKVKAFTWGGNGSYAGTYPAA